MIISHYHRFIFYAIPKTASQSIRCMLRPHLHKYDWEQCSLFEEKSFPIPELAKLKLGHISYQQLSPFLLKEMKDNYFSFCFVRHPLDRFLSYCFFKHSDDHRMKNEPIVTMKEVISRQSQKSHVMLQPQVSFITDETGRIMVNFIGRYERLNTDYLNICHKIGLDHTKPIVVNQSERVSNMKITREIFDWIYDYYSDDFQTFNYMLKE